MSLCAADLRVCVEKLIWKASTESEIPWNLEI
jgi:hypothetical protein